MMCGVKCNEEYPTDEVNDQENKYWPISKERRTQWERCNEAGVMIRRMCQLAKRVG